MSAIECGTYAGYQRHLRRKEPTDDACREAAREYMREYRAANPFRARADRRQALAHHAAMARLRARHSREFDRLYAEELRSRPSPHAPDAERAS